MTLAPARTLGSARIDRFSPEQLLRTARLFASDPDLTTLIDHQSGERRWVELDSSPYLQIWLLPGPPAPEPDGTTTAIGRATLVDIRPAGQREQEGEIDPDLAPVVIERTSWSGAWTLAIPPACRSPISACGSS